MFVAVAFIDNEEPVERYDGASLDDWLDGLSKKYFKSQSKKSETGGRNRGLDKNPTQQLNGFEEI